MNEFVLCREDVNAALNKLSMNPRKALLMTAMLILYHAFIHDAGNFGQSAFPSAYGVLWRKMKRLIENDPNFKGVLSVVTDE